MSLLRIDHVQITAPRAREREARHFYVNVLGLRELERPRTIPASGLWFALDEMTELHVVLVEDPFRPPAPGGAGRGGAPAPPAAPDASPRHSVESAFYAPDGSRLSRPARGGES